MAHWSHDAVFYHLYPLGACEAPEWNELGAPPENRLEKLFGWIGHWQELGVNALYLGPLFESTKHGYDTADYFRVDRRLGTNELLARLVAELHRAGIRVILDGVFHHVGRSFWAFRDVQERRQGSPYCNWFSGLRFDRSNGYGDPFGYDSWRGHEELVKLNLHEPAVRDHLFQAVASWVHDFGIDGLRLDVAECMDLGFLRDLSGFCRNLRPDFWLLGEVIHGDYRRWAGPGMLDATTNYEAYKGLWSSFNDGNMFEIGYALRRQFAEGGLYRGLPMYAFVDNHDVDRIGSVLKNPAHLYPLHVLLFTMPGVPSIYYGSEWGIAGAKKAGGDAALRPRMPEPAEAGNLPHPELATAIGRLARLRQASVALRHGAYRELKVAAQQLVFAREGAEETVVVAINGANEPVKVQLPSLPGGALTDVLNGGERFERPSEITLPACWGRGLSTRGG